MNAGRVELDLVAVGKDQVSAMLRQVDAQLKKTAGAMGETGAAATSVGSKIDNLKDATKPINKVREGFENLKANLGLIMGAAAGVAAIFTAISDALDENGKKIKRWEEQQKTVNATLESTRQLLEDIDIFLGKKTVTESGTKLEQVRKKWEDNEAAIREAEEAIKAYNARIDDLRAKLMNGEADAVEKKLVTSMKALEDATENKKRLEEDTTGLLARQTEELRAQTQEIRDQSKWYRDVLDTMIKMATTPPRKSLLEAWGDVSSIYDPQFSDNPMQSEEAGFAPGKKKPRGGGTKKGFDQDAFNRAQQSKFKDWIMEQEKAAAYAAKLAADMGGGGSPDRGEGTSEPGAQLAAMATDAEKLRDALQGVADATGLVSEAMPEMGDALSEIEGIVSKVAAANGSLTDALPAMGVALAANAAKAIGGVRAEAAVRAAYEVGMGFATIANPVESAGHFTAAVLLGAVAAGAGGGSKGGGSRASGGGSSGGSQGNSGPSTIVYNFSTLVTDRQQVTTAIRQSTRASAGTGASSRAGV